MTAVVYTFKPRSGGEEVDPFLSAGVGLIRSRLGVVQDSNDVVISPPLDNEYLPELRPNGSLKVASDGINDFNETFGCLLGDKSTALYVLYYAAQHTLIKRRAGDPAFHARLEEAVPVVRSLFPGVQFESVHTAEDTVIGLISSTLATNLTKGLADNKTNQKHFPLKISRAAARSPKSKLAFEGERNRTMSHFKTGLSPHQQAEILKPLQA